MVGQDDLLGTIEAVYDAGLDAALWPKALAGVTRLVGGIAATVQIFGKESRRPREFYFYGLPSGAKATYVDHYAALNQRLPNVTAGRLGELSQDYRIFNEETISPHQSFNAGFFGALGHRYFVGGIVATHSRDFAGVCVHRTTKQGHIDRPGLTMLERLLPHVKGAFDVARRLKVGGGARDALECALDWLADGVALLRADGIVIHANKSFLTTVRAADGVHIVKGVMEVDAEEARVRLAAVLTEAAKPPPQRSGAAGADFQLTRPSGALPYLVSVRPVPVSGREPGLDAVADAILFLRDPSRRNATASQTLRMVFGLTEAEAALARALQDGVTASNYAKGHAISRNTVYTHLRRVKEKVGCRRLPELIRKLNDVQLPLRPYHDG
jgi:DNA-binding CsgD family transcriptional regulator